MEKLATPSSGPWRTLEVRASSATQPVHRNDILADRAAVAIEIMDFDLQRARVIACIANLALDRHPAPASHQVSFGDLDRLDANQAEEHVTGEA